MTLDDDGAREAAIAFARDMAAFWEARLGPRLLGFYLLGSLAHGGFSRRYSDIDVGLIAEGGVAEDDLAAMRKAAEAAAPALAAKLSLFWTDRGFAVGRFPPLDRADFLDHRVTLVERDPVRPPRPTLAEVRDYLRGAPYLRWAERAAHYAAAERLEASDHKPYLRAHLYPARLIASWWTGRMMSNDDAVALIAAAPPAGLDIGLINEALACRRAGADPDALFPARTRLPGQAAACARLIAG